MEEICFLSGCFVPSESGLIGTADEKGSLLVNWTVAVIANTWAGVLLLAHSYSEQQKRERPVTAAGFP